MDRQANFLYRVGEALTGEVARLTAERDEARAALAASVREQNARLEAAERSLYLKLNEAERERDEAKALLRGLVAGHPDDRAHWQACPACRCAFAEPPA